MGTVMVSPRDLLNSLISEEKLGYCQNCGTCTASCPVARVIPEQYNPRTLLQRVHLDPEKTADSEDLAFHLLEINQRAGWVIAVIL